MKRQPTHLIGILAIAISIAWLPRSADASSVTGSVGPASGGPYDLTALGSLDWVHYGLLGGGDSNDGEPIRDIGGSIIGAPARPSRSRPIRAARTPMTGATGRRSPAAATPMGSTSTTAAAS